MINVKQFNRQVSDVITSYYKEPTNLLNYSQMDFNDELMTQSLKFAKQPTNEFPDQGITSPIDDKSVESDHGQWSFQANYVVVDPQNNTEIKAQEQVLEHEDFTQVNEINSSASQKDTGLPKITKIIKQPPTLKIKSYSRAKSNFSKA